MKIPLAASTSCKAPRNSRISRSDTLGGVRFGAAVAKADEDVEDNLLEEAVVALHKACEQVLGKGGPDLPVSGIDRLLRRGIRDREVLWRLC